MEMNANGTGTMFINVTYEGANYENPQCDTPLSAIIQGIHNGANVIAVAQQVATGATLFIPMSHIMPFEQGYIVGFERTTIYNGAVSKVSIVVHPGQVIINTETA